MQTMKMENRAFFNFNTEDSSTSAEENNETVPEETTDKKAEKPLKTFSRKNSVKLLRN